MVTIDFGHEPEPVTVVKCGKCHRDIDAEGRHVPRWDEKARAEGAEARAKVEASLTPYTGRIERCQAGVSGRDRWASYSRCERRPTVIRETTRDGRMAVCKTHGKAMSVDRFRGITDRWRGGPQAPADEVVE